MAVLGIDKLLKLVEEKKLLENLCERELKNPEGTGFDLRIGKLYLLNGEEGFLGVEERVTPKLNLIAEYNPEKKITTYIKPGEYYIVTTIEKVNTPDNLVGFFRPKTTLFMSGISLDTGICSPGYCGELNFGLKNHSNYPFKIEMGARIAHITFNTIKGKTKLYGGQWQGGRVTTNGEKEKQI